MKRGVRGVRAGLIVSVFLARSALASDGAPPTTAACLAAAESSLAMRGQHRLRAARAQLLICSAPTCPGDVRAECIRRVGEVNAAIPTIVFEAKDPAGNDLSEIRVTMDGQMIAERLDGPALSLDPGVHAFVFELPGQAPVRKKFVIREGDKDRRERITLGSASESAPAAAAPAARAPAASPPPPIIYAAPAEGSSRRAHASSSSGGMQKGVGLTLMIAGVAGLAAGGAYTFVYESRVKDFNGAGCSSSLPGYGPVGCESRHAADQSARQIFIAGYAAGILLGGLGAVLFLTAPGDDAAPADVARLGSPRVGLRCLPSAGAGVVCGGRF